MPIPNQSLPKPTEQPLDPGLGELLLEVVSYGRPTASTSKEVFVARSKVITQIGQRIGIRDWNRIQDYLDSYYPGWRDGDLTACEDPTEGFARSAESLGLNTGDIAA